MEVQKIDYYYATVPNKPGEASSILTALSKEAGVSLLGFCGFPQGAHKAQLDFVPSDATAFTKAARKLKLKLSKKKTVFMVRGRDRENALRDVMDILTQAEINVTAVQAVSAGGGRYSALLWVKQPDVRKAAGALGAV